MTNTMTREQAIERLQEALQYGNACAVDVLIEYQDTEETRALSASCWTHSEFVDGGEPYDTFMARFRNVVHKVLDVDLDTLWGI